MSDHLDYHWRTLAQPRLQWRIEWNVLARHVGIAVRLISLITPGSGKSTTS